MATRLDVGEVSFAISGRLVRMAAIDAETWVSGASFDPDACIRALLNAAGPRSPDLFTFAQPLSDRTPRHRYPMEWDSVAAMSLTSVDDWWRRLPWKSRSNARRAEKRGVVAAVVPFDDALVHGIVGINNATAMRQGRRFSHFQEPIDTVRRAHATYLDRSTFIGAYDGQELVGYAKVVRVDDVAAIMQFLVTPRQHEKRPANALIAAVVEHAVASGASFLRFGAYHYGNKRSSSLTEFKRRVGFEDVRVPRYFVPLNRKGRLALRLGLHRPLIGVVPASVISPLLDLRRAWSKMLLAASARAARR